MPATAKITFLNTLTPFGVPTAVTDERVKVLEAQLKTLAQKFWAVDGIQWQTSAAVDIRFNNTASHVDDDHLARLLYEMLQTWGVGWRPLTIRVDVDGGNFAGLYTASYHFPNFETKTSQLGVRG